MSIFIIGMGVSGGEDLNQRQLREFDKRDNYFRTDHHDVALYFKSQGKSFKSYDFLYEEKSSLEEVYQGIVSDLKVVLAEGRDINYWVPGHPFIAEETVRLLFSDEEISKEDITVLPAMSYIDVMSVALKRPIAESVRIHDALGFQYFQLNPAVDQIFLPLDSLFLASEIKEKLLEVYLDEYEVCVVHAPGTEREFVQNIRLQYLDTLDYYNHETVLFVPKTEKRPYSFSDLVEVIHRLRGPEGCPWDREQTHESLKSCLLEESYEVLDAIEKQDFNALEEELGDLLLQVVLHAEIAQEVGYFNILTIIHRLVEKLIYRHPHVFGNKTIKMTKDVEKTWEMLKRDEKLINSMTEELKNLPKLLPNLMKSYKIQKKVARVGFDWPDLDGALEKIQEELQEVVEAIKTFDKSNIEEELGDLFFSVVNISRKLEIDPEISLAKTNDKFIRRFAYIESHLDKPLQEATLEEMDALWEEAKKDIKIRHN